MQRERMILRQRGPEQRAQLLLVLGRGDDEVRQLALGGQREHALVARPVLPDEPGPVDGDQHRLVVLADVVDGLVESLAAGRSNKAQTGRIPGRKACGEGHRVLLGDPDIEHPVREARRKHPSRCQSPSPR